MIRSCITLSLAAQPWLRDHCFGGQAVLPAVETLALLAAHAQQCFPEIDVRRMEDASFARFLKLPHSGEAIEVVVETEAAENGRVRAALLSRAQGRTLSRLKEHGVVFFPCNTPDSPLPALPVPPAPTLRTLSAGHIYRELVPFGPHYHTLCGNLLLAETTALGWVRAPMRPILSAEGIGSPFPFDGALHAACVLGQQRVAYVPFPTGFNRRHILCPTIPGSHYAVTAQLRAEDAEGLLFDITLSDSKGQLCESASGVRMRDVGQASTTRRL